MKILGLDIGDKWTGVAISDPLAMFAHPYETVPSKDLKNFLERTIKKEELEKIVVGYPKTMAGTESEQTKKIVASKNELEKYFPDIKWILWDERLSSKRAQALKKPRNKAEKQKSHSIAAAFILETYLMFLHSQKK